MKYHILFLIFCGFFSSIHTHAQQHIVDANWYVLNNGGLDGNKLKSAWSSLAIEDDYKGIWAEEMDNTLRISGITEPSSKPEGVRDDLFIIYKNGDFYSSRNESVKWTYASHPNGNRVVTIRSDNNVAYAYWTRKYDDDDLPTKVTVKRSENPTDAVGTTEMHESPMAANHDVAFGKDITIIINNHSVSGEYLSLRFNKLTPDSNYTGTQLIDEGNVIQQSSLFDVSPIFRVNENEPRYILPGTIEFDYNNDEIVIKKANQPYTFINLRATDTLNKYAFAGEGIKDHLAIFELTNAQGQVIHQLVEHTGPIHDPNYIVAKSVCTDCNSIYYEGQFFNASSTPAGRLAVEFTVPSALDRQSIDLTFAKIGNLSIPINEITLDSNARKISLNFPNTTTTQDSLLISFGFCIKKKESRLKIQTLKPEEFLVKNAFTVFNKGTSSSLKYSMDVWDNIERFSDLPHSEKLLVDACGPCNSSKICQKEPWWKTPPGVLGISAAILLLVAAILRNRFFPKPKFPGPPQGY